MQNYNSKIFWHFTGSPININWELVHKPSDILKFGQPKSIEQSLDILKRIISTQTLLATCHERVYGYRRTEKFCCVTDIPLSHLDQHKDFYGSVAIGFNSASIYKYFNPVLYAPNNQILESAISELNYFQRIQSLAQFDMNEDDAIRNGWIKNADETWMIPALSVKYDENTRLEKHLLNHLKVTSFSDDPKESFYREREWRSIGNFLFKLKDIEAVIVPKDKVAETFGFLSEFDAQLNKSILTWDLILKT